MVIEHQTFKAEKMLLHHADVSDDLVPQMLKGIRENISVIEFNICGDIIVAKKNGGIDFMIPVDMEFSSNEYFSFKELVMLVNAAKLRHYGSFCTIHKNLTELNNYIAQKSLTPITPPFIVERDAPDNAYDIYIGISENIF